MEFMLNSSTFPVVAMALGVVAFADTVLADSLFWVAVAVGGIFGLGGFLFDYFTDSRYAGRQVSASVLAVGAGLVAFYWLRVLLVEGQAQVSVWLPVIQYVGFVLMSCAAFCLPPRRNEH